MDLGPALYTIRIDGHLGATMLTARRFEVSPANPERVSAAVPVEAPTRTRYAKFLIGELESERSVA